MLSEADLIAKRATLCWLAQCHPYWTHQELADTLGMSRSWVSKWRKPLRQADAGDVMAFHSCSRARHTPPASIASQAAVVQRILEIRTAPPENLQRVPGPETILYYLHRDPTRSSLCAQSMARSTTKKVPLFLAFIFDEQRGVSPGHTLYKRINNKAARLLCYDWRGQTCHEVGNPYRKSYNLCAIRGYHVSKMSRLTAPSPKLLAAL